MDRINDWKIYKEEAEPIVDLLKTVNDGYSVAYEYDRDDFCEGNPYLEDGKGATRSKWGIDLSRTHPIKKGGHLYWGNNLEHIRKHVLYHVTAQAIKHRGELQNFFRDRELDRKEHFTEAFRNLTNSWRDEYALNHPQFDSEEVRAQTAEWRIIQMYYTVFKSTSAIMRSKFENIREDGRGNHDGLWEKHRRKCMDELQTKLYPFPFMYFSVTDNPRKKDAFSWEVPYPIHEDFHEDQKERQDGYAQDKLESIYESSQKSPYIQGELLFTFYDLLKELREWAQYQQGGIFSRLYGETHIKALDHALRLIAYTALTVAEVALIHNFGFSEFEDIYLEYKESCKEGQSSDSLYLVYERYKVYRKVFPTS